MVSLAEAKLEIEELQMKVSDVKLSYHDIRQVEYSITRIGNALARMTGSPEVQQAIDNLNRLISTIRMAQATLHAFEIAEGPIGWLFFAASAIGTAIVTYDAMRGL